MNAMACEGEPKSRVETRNVTASALDVVLILEKENGMRKTTPRADMLARVF
jgi:hypothetical protein